MQKITPLLLDDQLHRAVVRAMDFIPDNHIFYPGNQGLGNEEIVQPPTDVALAGITDIGPPSVLDALRVQMAVNVHEAVVKEFLHPFTLFRQKTGVFLVLFRVFQVDGAMGGIEIASDDEILPSCVEGIALFEQVGIEIQFVIEAVFAALSVREVNIEQTESGVERGNDAPFCVKTRRIHTQPGLQSGSPQKGRDSTVSCALGWIPDRLVTGKIALAFRQLVGAGFNLLQAKHIGALPPCPVESLFSQDSAQSVDVPCDYLHCFCFIPQDWLCPSTGRPCCGKLHKKVL